MKGLVAAVAALASGSAVAAAGDLDCTFGAGGKAQLDFGNGPAEAFFDMVLQPDGKLVTIGSGGGSFRLTRLTAGGDLDPTFGTNGTIVHTLPNLGFAGYIARDSQGRFVVGGRIDVAGDNEALVVRLTPTGQLDSTFGGGDGWASADFTAATASTGNDIVTAVAVDASDRPVLAGYADPNGNTSNPSNADFAIARFTTAGTLDATFSGDGLATASSPGTATDDTARAVSIGSDGIITVVGDYWTGASNQPPRSTLVVRLRPDGTPDTAFDADGLLTVDLAQNGGDDFAFDIGHASDGDLFVLAQGGPDGNDAIVGRINLDGTFDDSWGGDGAITRSFLGGQDVVEDLVVQADGKVIVTGWPVVGGTFHFATMRLDTAGALDASWGGTGVVTTNIAFIDRAYAAVLQPNQRLVLAGGLDNDVRAVAVRYLADADGLSLNTTTAITSDAPDPSVLGQPVAVGITVTSAGAFPPTGTFSVSDGPAQCTGTLGASSGNASSGTCNIVLNAGGTRTLTAQFDGSAGSCRSSATTAHTVTRPATTVAIVSDTPDPSIQGQSVNVAWSVGSAVAGTQTGNVTVSDGTNSCTAAVAAGSCSLSLINSGERPLTASYAGDANFAPSVSTAEPHTVLVQVTPGAGANGAISPATPQAGARLSTLQFALLPDAGFHVDAATGCSGARTGNTFTTGPLIANCNVDVTFNADPIGVPGDQFVLEDSGANAAQLFASDADALTFAIATPPTKGTVAITNPATGAYTYTPNANAVGADSFAFRASDAGGSSLPTTIAIAITPVNDAPALALASVPAIAGGTTAPQSFAGFAAFDAGPPDEDATQAVAQYLLSVDDPSGILVAGSAAVATDGTLTLTPTGLPGSATLTVRVRDDGGTANGGFDTSAPQLATITVANSADLQVAKDNGRIGVVGGDIVTYAIVAANAGPSAVVGATLADPLPATLANATWSCRAELSTVPCPAPASGTGSLQALVDLPVGAVLRYDFTATVTGATGAFVVNTATIAPPAGTTALATGNDSSTDQDAIVPDGIFGDGFENAGSGLTVESARAVLGIR